MHNMITPRQPVLGATEQLQGGTSSVSLDLKPGVLSFCSVPGHRRPREEPRSRLARAGGRYRLVRGALDLDPSPPFCPSRLARGLRSDSIRCCAEMQDQKAVPGQAGLRRSAKGDRNRRPRARWLAVPIPAY